MSNELETKKKAFNKWYKSLTEEEQILVDSTRINNFFDEVIKKR